MYFIGSFSHTNTVSQNFENLFLITILCYVIASPINRGEEFQVDDPQNPANFISERQRIIAEFKAKLLSRLNLSQLPKINKSFDWTTIPEEMKNLLNQEIVTEDDTRDSKSKIETMIIPLVKMNSCGESSVINQQCLNLSLSDLGNKEIISANLIIPITKKAIGNKFPTSISYNITVNNQSELTYDLSLNRDTSNSVTIDWTVILNTLLNDDDDFDMIRSVLSWTVSIIGSNQAYPVERMMDLKNIILEVQYKSPPKLLRKKRRSNNCQSNQFFCCTEKLVASLEDLGYSEFILAPRHFTINYCRGDCNNYITYSSNHAIAVHFARKKDIQPRKEIRSCCVPYSYQNFTFMYLKPDNSIAIETFNDLIASTCGCL